MKKKHFLVLAVALMISIFLVSCGNQAGGNSSSVKVKRTAIPTPSPTRTLPPSPPPPPGPTPTYLPPVSSSATLGIDGNSSINYSGIPWVRLGYPTCGGGNLRGSTLQSTIEKYHTQGIRVLLLICQWTRGTGLYDMKFLNDAAQGGADAVACGNEQMKYGYYNMYVTPEIFARFFDNCTKAMHSVRPDIPIILGSLDPHVGGIDYAPLYDQVAYLNAMQYAMNTQVHSGGHWNWRSQILGLIDSWHNGWPGGYVNSLYGLFSFWAQQFGVDPGSGGLGKHIWVTEGTGCFKGCGVPYDSYDIAVSHILTLITDVQTSMRYQIPFFYFSGPDFISQGVYWPIGILSITRHPKPLRQDLWMGARSLTLSCAVGPRTVVDQLQLLARMYSGCTLPGNYVAILEG